jgi:hypothetical protein
VTKIAYEASKRDEESKNLKDVKQFGLLVVPVSLYKLYRTPWENETLEFSTKKFLVINAGVSRGGGDSKGRDPNPQQTHSLKPASHSLSLYLASIFTSYLL